MLMSPMRDGQSTSEDRATQLLICEPLSFAMLTLSTDLANVVALVSSANKSPPVK